MGGCSLWLWESATGVWVGVLEVFVLLSKVLSKAWNGWEAINGNGIPARWNPCGWVVPGARKLTSCLFWMGMPSLCKSRCVAWGYSWTSCCPSPRLWVPFTSFASSHHSWAGIAWQQPSSHWQHQGLITVMCFIWGCLCIVPEATVSVKICCTVDLWSNI